MALDPTEFPTPILSYRLSSAMLAAMELGIPDAIAAGTRSVPDLAAELGCDVATLGRLMRVLVAAEVFASEGGRLVLTGFSELMCSNVEGSMNDMILGWHGLRETYQAFGALPETVRTGEPPFARLHGQKFHDYLASHPDRNLLYSRANESTTDAFDAAVAAYPFGECPTLVDVGGGRGSFLKAICTKYPQVHGIVFDLPTVVAGVGDELAAEGFDGRIEVQPGDAFESVPRGDAYLFSTVLRCFTDEACHRVLANVLKASPEARLIIIDFVMEETPPLRSAMADLQNLMTYGGCDRTRTEWEHSLAAAGYGLNRVILVPDDPLPILEARPVARR